jgi:hypothetical protein
LINIKYAASETSHSALVIYEVGEVKKTDETAAEPMESSGVK